MCKYGAAMGRRSHSPAGVDVVCTLNVRRVYLDAGGYERGDGCVYWGIGAPLYRATDDARDVDFYFRAADRRSAIEHVRERWPNAHVIGTKRAPLSATSGEEISRLTCEGEDGTRYVLRVFDCAHLGKLHSRPSLCVRRLGYVFGTVDGVILSSADNVDPESIGALRSVADDSEAMARGILVRAWSQADAPESGPGFVRFDAGEG